MDRRVFVKTVGAVGAVTLLGIVPLRGTGTGQQRFPRQSDANRATAGEPGYQGPFDVAFVISRLIPEIDKSTVFQFSGVFFAEAEGFEVIFIQGNQVIEELGIASYRVSCFFPALDSISHPIYIFIGVFNRQPGGMIGFPSCTGRAICHDGRVFIRGQLRDDKVYFA